MSIHWAVYRSLFRRAFETIVHDDKRSYRGIDIAVASLHVSRAICTCCESPRIGLLLPTSGAFPIAMLGAWATGKAIVPLNYLLKPDELQYIIDDAGLDTILAVQPMLDFLGAKPKVRTLVTLDDINFTAPPPLRIPAAAKPDDIAAIVYTSGTSGKPKGVMLSHKALKANATQGAKGLGMTPRDTMIGVLPQFHCYGMTQLTLTPLMFGVRIVYTARFVPKRLVDLIQKHKATIMVGIPSMYNAMASLKSATPESLASLQLTVSGSEPLPQAVFDRFRERFNIELTEGYGMTEMAPATHCNPKGVNKRGTVGPPLPGVEQRIVDTATNQDLPPGRDGEVRLRGPNLMAGYLNLPDLTAAAFDDKGFYRTGDLGRIDDQGFLAITGRIKEMMIVGGENVFPREIEEVLNRHPLVHDSGVIPQTDPMRGETPVAFVELKEDANPADFSEHALTAFCREHLAGYKVPKRIIAIPALPRNPTGKVLRRDLKPLLAQLDQPATAND